MEQEPRWSRHGLARFRVDPARVRIGVRRTLDGWWLVTITSRESPFLMPVVSLHSISPVKALVRALRRADNAKIPGIDLGMGWAYPHPHGPYPHGGYPDV